MKTIWLVDDDPIHTMLAERAIQKIAPQLTIETFHHPEVALMTWQSRPSKERPCVVLLDIEMPEMNGFEWANAVGPDLESDEQPTSIHMVSSSVNPLDIERAAEHPYISDYTSKPVGLELYKVILAKYCDILSESF